MLAIKIGEMDESNHRPIISDEILFYIRGKYKNWHTVQFRNGCSDYNFIFLGEVNFELSEKCYIYSNAYIILYILSISYAFLIYKIEIVPGTIWLLHEFHFYHSLIRIAEHIDMRKLKISRWILGTIFRHFQEWSEKTQNLARKF